MMTSSGRVLTTITIMTTLLCSVGFGASRASMGIVTSSLPFSISDTIVEGDGTVLEGRASRPRTCRHASNCSAESAT